METSYIALSIFFLNSYSYLSRYVTTIIRPIKSIQSLFGRR